MVRIQRYQVAPGEASGVASRIEFSRSPGGSTPPKRFETENSVKFVTAHTGQLSILDSVFGWLDPYVTVHTYAEHFGTQTPSSVTRLGFQAMVGAKQIAEYVAMKKLGLDATFTEGPVIIQQLVCTEDSRPSSACKMLEVGETITAVNGVNTETLSQLSTEMKKYSPGDRITVTVIPYDAKANKPDSKKAVRRVVEVIENPDVVGKALIGFTPADTRTVGLPFNVDISTTSIGGPSAGLAFTLALIDELSPGNLMGKNTVVATGTINENGEVGAIGALEQKAVAVREAGGTLFLVPKGQSDAEITAARKAAGPSVVIRRVANIDDALRILAARGGSGVPAAQL